MIRPPRRRAAILTQRRKPQAAETPTLLRFAATNQRIATGGTTGAGTTTMLTQRSKHIAGGALREIVIGLMAWRVGSVEADQPNPWYVDKLAIEIGSTAVPVTFSGARAATVSPGVAILLSDPVPASAFSMASIPRDTVMGVRLAAHVADSTAAFPTVSDGSTVSFVNASATETGGFANFHAYRHTPANFIDQIDATGPMTAPTGANLNSTSLPLFVLGRFADATKAVMALGDSITGGTGDLYGANIPSPAGSGYAMRASLDAGDLNAIPLFNAGRLSYALANWDVATAATANGRSNIYRKYLMRYADVVTNALGINDINTLTVEQMQPLYQQLWADVRANGAPGAVLKQVTMIPSTRLRDYAVVSLTTSGTTATLVTTAPHAMITGQSAVVASAVPTAYNGTKTVTVVDANTLIFTITAGTANATTNGVLRWTNAWLNRWSQAPTAFDGVRTTLNSWFGTQVGGVGGVDAVIDMVPAIADPADATVWATNGTANYPTVDGVHPASVSHGLMAAVYRTGVV